MYIRFKKIKIHIICLVLISVVAAINFSFYTILLTLAIIIHESGHIIFIKKYRLKITSLEIFPMGIKIKTDCTLLSYKQDIAVSAAGPLFNLLTCLIVLIFLKLGGYSEKAVFFLAANFVYATINLFPVKSLDGGTVCRLFLKIYFPEHTAYYVFTVISSIFLALLSFGAFIVLMVTRYNFTLVLLCCYLFYTIHFSPKSDI